MVGVRTHVTHAAIAKAASTIATCLGADGVASWGGGAACPTRLPSRIQLVAEQSCTYDTRNEPQRRSEAFRLGELNAWCAFAHHLFVRTLCPCPCSAP